MVWCFSWGSIMKQNFTPHWLEPFKMRIFDNMLVLFFGGSKRNNAHQNPKKKSKNCGANSIIRNQEKRTMYQSVQKITCPPHKKSWSAQYQWKFFTNYWQNGQKNHISEIKVESGQLFIVTHVARVAILFPGEISDHPSKFPEIYHWNLSGNHLLTPLLLTKSD